jgi:hypothetical protein
MPSDEQPDNAELPEPVVTHLGEPVITHRGETVTVSRRGLSGLMVGLGLIGLAAALLLAGLNLRSNSDSSGAATPADAIAAVLEAVANEDIIAFGDSLLPTERATLMIPILELLDELKRLEVLDPSMDPSHVSGIDYEFDDVVYEMTPITDDLATIRVVGGTVTSSFEPTALPIGRLIRDRLPDGALGEPTDETTASTGSADNLLAAVRYDGGWYFSIWYSAAEIARAEAGLDVPDLNLRIQAQGATSAEAAVEEMIRASADLDLRRILELLAPQEAVALHDYAPLFLSDAEQTADTARDELLSSGTSIDIRRIDLESRAHRNGRLVTIHGGAIDIATPEINLSLDIGDGSARVVMTDTNAHSTVVFEASGRCLTMTTTGPRGAEERETFCDDELEDMLNEQFGLGEQFDLGEIPDFNIFTTRPSFGIATVEHEGAWFISPLGTMFGAQLDTLAAIDTEKLETLVDWIIDGAQTADFGV